MDAIRKIGQGNFISRLLEQIEGSCKRLRIADGVTKKNR